MAARAAHVLRVRGVRPVEGAAVRAAQEGEHARASGRGCAAPRTARAPFPRPPPRGRPAVDLAPRVGGLGGRGPEPARTEPVRCHACSAGCAGRVPHRDAAAAPAGRDPARPGGVAAAPRTSRSPSGRQQVDQRVVGEPGEREVQLQAAASSGVLALGGGPRGAVQLVGAEAQPCGLLLRELLLSVTSWKSQPTPSGTGSSPSGEPSRTKPLRQQRRAPPSAARRRHPQLGGRGRRPLGEDVLQRALQLLHALVEQVPQRAPQQRVPAGAAVPGRRAR